MSTDPFVAQLQALLSAEESTAAQQRQGAIRRAYIDFGADLPSMQGFDTGFFAGDIDPTTRAQAAANTAAGLSQWARMEKEFNQRQQGIGSELAAKGMLNSGENAWAQEQLALGRKQSLYDAGKNYLDYITQQYGGYQQGVLERNQRLFQGQQEAAMRQQQRQFEQAQMDLQRQQMAQEMALAQQQMAMDMQAIAAQNAASAGGGGGEWGGGAPEQGGGGGGPAAPTAAQQAAMAAQAGRAARHRDPAVQALFQQFADWRGANPGWQHGGGGGGGGGIPTIGL